MKEFHLRVECPDKAERLDLYLARVAFKGRLGLSRTTIQRLIVNGKITLDGKPTRAHHRVKAGEQITIIQEKPPSSAIQPQEIPLDIIYQDDDLAIINKPVGLVVHPGAGNYQHTLVNALVYHFNQLSCIHPQRPGIVHRLDKETSGLLVVVKNNQAHLGLARQFAKHSVKRQYTALVKGVMEFDEQVIDLPLGRHDKDFRKMSVSFSEQGKFARTHYRTLKRTKQASLIELNPFTGRTHQLRVHLAFIGHPILGDKKYDPNSNFPRLALHANYIGFLHPTTKKPIEFSCPLPEEFLAWINKNKS